LKKGFTFLKKILKKQGKQIFFENALTTGIIYDIISPLVNPMSKNIEKIYARYKK